MFTVIISEKGGEQRRMDFDKPEVTIGRVQGNDIILPKGNVSKRHSRIVLKDGKFIIVDLKSTNGTYVNGRKITSPLVLKESDKVYIGDFILTVEEGAADAQPHSLTPLPPPAPPTGVYVDASGAPGATPSIVSNPPPVPRRPPAPPPMPSRRAPEPEPEELDDGLDMAPPLPAPARPTVPAPVHESSPGPRAPAPREPVPTRDLAREGAKPTRDLGGVRIPAAVPPPPPPPPPRPDPLAARAQAVGGRPAPEPAPVPPPKPAEPAQPLRSAPRRTEPVDIPVPAPPMPVAPPVVLTGGGAGAPRPRATLKSFDAVVPPEEAAPSGRALELVRELHDKIAAKLDLARLPVERLADEALWQRAETAVCDLVEQLEADGAVPAGLDQDGLIKDALNELLGVGPLEDLLADDEVTDVLVDRADKILVERGGRVVASDKVFSSEAALRQAIDRLLAPTGRKLDAANPLVEARLAGGTRVAAALPPLAVRGPCLTVRKPRRTAGASSMDELVRGGGLSAQMASFLGTAVAARRNIVVCGGAAAGKSALVAALAGLVPAQERVVSVEEVAEIGLAHEHWIALEARPPEDGRPGIGFADVVRAALRMRPDRLVVGEVRGVEALEVLTALAAGAEGAIVAVGGDSTTAALARLESLARLAAPEASARGLRELVAHAAHIVAHVARFADGVRRVTSIVEVTGPQGEGYAVRELFSFQMQGQGDAGVRGRFAGAGIVPRFYEQLQARGESADPAVFR